MRYIFVLLAVVIISSGAVAQDTTALEPVNICTEEETQAFVESLLELVQTPAEGGLFEQLDVLANAVTTYRWQCSGMALSGDKEAGRSTVVVGPVSIPDGLYRVTLTTDETFIIDETELSGDCRLFFAVIKGDASAGTEELFEYDDDCTMLLEVEARGPWEIKFVLVSAGS